MVPASSPPCPSKVSSLQKYKQSNQSNYSNARTRGPSSGRQGNTAHCAIGWVDSGLFSIRDFYFCGKVAVELPDSKPIFRFDIGLQL